MKGENLIVKLSPGSLWLKETYGGWVKIDSMEVAGALGMAPLHEKLILMARALYLDDNRNKTLLEELERYAYQAAAKITAKKRWKVTGRPKGDDREPVTRLLVRRILEEMICPRLYFCRTCSGTGHVRASSRNELGICPTCNGHRVRPVNASQMADIIGVSPTAYRSTWQERHAEFSRELQTWGPVCLRYLFEQFKPEEELCPIGS